MTMNRISPAIFMLGIQLKDYNEQKDKNITDLDHVNYG